MSHGDNRCDTCGDPIPAGWESWYSVADSGKPPARVHYHMACILSPELAEKCRSAVRKWAAELFPDRVFDGWFDAWVSLHDRFWPQHSDKKVIDHDMTDMPVCPYCGHAATCVADLLTQPGIERGDGSGLCGDCGREYRVTLHVSHSYTTAPTEAVK